MKDEGGKQKAEIRRKAEGRRQKAESKAREQSAWSYPSTFEI